MAQLTTNKLVVMTLEDEPWWNDLKTEEKLWLKRASYSLGEELIKLGHSRLRIGEQLVRINEILAPRRLFDKFIRENFRQSRATARRYMDAFHAAQRMVSPRVLEVAMANGFDHVPPEKMKEIPADIEDAGEIMEILRETPKRRHVLTIEQDPRVIVREAFNLVQSRLKRLPERQRENRARDLCSMILASAGCRVIQKIKPEEDLPAYRIKFKAPKKKPKKRAAQREVKG